jgi:hypothetical protein
MDEIRLGDVLGRIRRPIEVDPLIEYREIGIRSHGKGIFHKDPIAGGALGKKKVFQIEPGDLIINIVFAWEGAVAVAGPSEAGMCGSHRFPTYRPIDDRCDVQYIREVMLSPSGLRLMGLASPGSAGRNRTLNQQALLDARLVLPPVQEQRSIVHLLSSVRIAIERAAAVRAAARQATSSLLEAALASAAETRTLGSLAKMRSGPSWKAANESAEPFEGATPVLKITNTRPSGEIVMDKRAYVGGLPSSVMLLDAASLILIRTNGNRERIGNVYRATPEVVDHAVSAFQIAVKPGDPTLTDYLYWVLRAPSTQREMTAAASGSTGLGNLAIGWLKSLSVPWLEASARDQIVVTCNALELLASRAQTVVELFTRLRGALASDLLSGDHSIPEAYAAMLEAS